MTLPTLLCVGSGLTPRYRLNTLQALALPVGARIQFRYIARLIPDGLKKKLEDNAFKDATVLLGYVDCTAAARRPDNRCNILPYRYADLVSSRKVGSVFILQLEVRAFAISADLEAFQRNLTGDVPEWGMDNKLKGAWCNELPTDFKEVRPTTSLADWEEIVKQIRKREDFSKVAYFCTIEGLVERTTGKRLGLSNGEYVLRSNRDYELRIFHFDPDSDAHTGHKQTRWLRLSVVGPWLRFPTSPLLAIDSPYDVKSIHLVSGSTARQQYSSLVLRDEASATQNNAINSEQSLEMYLPVRIKGTVWQTSLYGLVLGTLLAAQQLLILYSQPVITTPIRITIATTVLGLGTGFFAAFGLSKPV